MGGGAGRAARGPPRGVGSVERAELGGSAGSRDGSAEWAWAPGSGSQFVPTSCSGFCPGAPTPQGGGGNLRRRWGTPAGVALLPQRACSWCLLRRTHRDPRCPLRALQGECLSVLALKT